jgi:hypothetical protein
MKVVYVLFLIAFQDGSAVGSKMSGFPTLKECETARAEVQAIVKDAGEVSLWSKCEEVKIPANPKAKVPPQAGGKS